MTSLHPVERIRAIRTHASDHSMQHCGVVLNLPAHVQAGKRLKCPRCATRFVVSEADASSDVDRSRTDGCRAHVI